MSEIIKFIMKNLPGHPILFIIVVVAILIVLYLIASRGGYLERVSTWKFGLERHSATLKCLAGEWKGTFHIIEGSRKNIPSEAEYTLMIAEHPFRSHSGILVYDAHDPSNNKRLYAGADMLLPTKEDSFNVVKLGSWKPTFKRCVHWQPPDDPRPEHVREIDEKGEHTYKWDVELKFTNNRAQMYVTITAQKTGNVFSGILEKNI